MKGKIRAFINKIPTEFIVVPIVVMLLFLFYKCPLNYFFHIPCPGCGFTRACLAAMRLDFIQAYNYYPLFLPVCMALVYLMFRRWIKIPTVWEIICGSLLTVAIVVVYIVRLSVFGLEILAYG